MGEKEKYDDNVGVVRIRKGEFIDRCTTVVWVRRAIKQMTFTLLCDIIEGTITTRI